MTAAYSPRGVPQGSVRRPIHFIGSTAKSTLGPCYLFANDTKVARINPEKNSRQPKTVRVLRTFPWAWVSVKDRSLEKSTEDEMNAIMKYFKARYLSATNKRTISSHAQCTGAANKTGWWLFTVKSTVSCRGAVSNWAFEFDQHKTSSTVMSSSLQDSLNCYRGYRSWPLIRWLSKDTKPTTEIFTTLKPSPSEAKALPAT